MTGNAGVVIGLAEIATAGDEFALVIPTEAGLGYDVEHAIGAIPLIGLVATALRFQRIDILGIDLRAQVVGDIGVWNLDPIDFPAGLMAAADVQLVVDEIRAWNEVGDHCQTVGAVRSRRVFDIIPIDERGRSGRLGTRSARALTVTGCSVGPALSRTAAVIAEPDTIVIGRVSTAKPGLLMLSA